MQKHFKKILFCIIFLSGFLMWGNAKAADYYIADTAAGSGNGTNCSNADAIANLTWGTGNMVAAGDTLHICGTITNTLAIGASGSADNPITIFFENNAKFSKPLWGDIATAAIYATNKSYITIDGGTNGIIENTANGTGLNNQAVSTGIRLQRASNFIIKNITIQNLYVRAADSDDRQRGIRAIWSIDTLGNNVIDNVRINFAEQGINFYNAGAAADGLIIKNCDISKVSTAIIVALGSAHDYSNVVIEDNHIYDLYYWDGCWGSCTLSSEWHHNDGIHTWGNYGAGANKLQITIRRNIIGGDFGAHTTSWVYLTDYTSDVMIYNNLLYNRAEPPSGGYVGLHTRGSANAKIYNNTIQGYGTGNTKGTGIYHAASGAWTTDSKNNIFDTVYVVTRITDTTASLTSNYNNIFNYSAAGAVNDLQRSLAQWQALGYDTPNTIINNPLFVSASDFNLQSNSPAINAGTDLSEYFTTDILGNPRSGVWDIGAYEYVGAADVVAPASPSGLAVS